jgi:hypothetical protein
MRTLAAILTLTALLAGAASTNAAPPRLPTLDEMAGDWIPFDNVANPPAVHNFHDMLLVDRDLTSVFCFPDDWLWSGKPKRGYPPVTLTLDGRGYPATDCRWFAYRALRRNPSCDGLVVESDTRMLNERRAVLVRVRVSNPGTTNREVVLALTTPGTASADRVSALNTTQRKGFATVTRPVQKPASIFADSGRVRWEWKASLAPGAERVFEFVAGDGRQAVAAAVASDVAQWAGDFTGLFDGFKQVWEQRWADAFTPGNKHFSGNLPVLVTDNHELARNYYMGALTMLILERTQFPVSPRAFITSGERAPGTQYYWDASMQATAWALLEPGGMKATLRRWLVQNVRGSPVIDIRQAKGFDARVHKQITGYAFNACTIFQTAYDYLRITGDLRFLDEDLENGQTVLERMEAIANDWRTLVMPGTPLANYGENHNLLECAPAYIHCVPSVNAQNVLLMREAAALHQSKGNAARAAELRADADKLLPAVLTLYMPGAGVWFGLHNDGKQVELRHCVDYIYVGNALAADLTPAMRGEMTEFVKRELFMRDWMRAMSLKDAAAARSDRPDHGPMGAYDGWIPLTVGAMWRLGFPKDGFEFYCRTAVVTKEGPFAQAREFYGTNRKAYDAPVRVAERQGCFKECISGAAFTDVVINTFFGFMPALGGQPSLVDPDAQRPFTARLLHVRNRGALATIIASQNGLRIETE